MDDCERPTGGGRLMEEGPNEPGLRPPRSTLRSCVSCRNKQNIYNVNVHTFFIGFCTLSSEDGTRSCHQDRQERSGVLGSTIDMTKRNDILDYSRTHKLGTESLERANESMEKGQIKTSKY